MMRPSLRRELYKLRELVHFLLEEEACHFCGKPLHSDTTFDRHGNSTGPALDVQITIHHKDGNHENNAHENKALCHTSCHKSYHRRLGNIKRAAARTEK